jgi:hypothetical protein
LTWCRSSMTNRRSRSQDPGRCDAQCDCRTRAAPEEHSPVVPESADCCAHDAHDAAIARFVREIENVVAASRPDVVLCYCTASDHSRKSRRCGTYLWSGHGRCGLTEVGGYGRSRQPPLSWVYDRESRMLHATNCHCRAREVYDGGHAKGARVPPEARAPRTDRSCAERR